MHIYVQWCLAAWVGYLAGKCVEGGIKLGDWLCAVGTDPFQSATEPPRVIISRMARMYMDLNMEYFMLFTHNSEYTEILKMFSHLCKRYDLNVMSDKFNYTVDIHFRGITAIVEEIITDRLHILLNELQFADKLHKTEHINRCVDVITQLKQEYKDIYHKLVIRILAKDPNDDTLLVQADTLVVTDDIIARHTERAIQALNGKKINPSSDSSLALLETVKLLQDNMDAKLNVFVQITTCDVYMYLCGILTERVALKCNLVNSLLVNEINMQAFDKNTEIVTELTRRRYADIKTKIHECEEEDWMIRLVYTSLLEDAKKKHIDIVTAFDMYPENTASPHINAICDQLDFKRSTYGSASSHVFGLPVHGDHVEQTV